MTARCWLTVAVGAAALVLGCGGGGDKEPEKPVKRETRPPPTEDEMFDPEVLDSIQRTFERKQTVVGRCFAAGIEAGDYKESARGFVTVEATITPSGTASGAKVLKSNLSSPALHKCITNLIETWTFEKPRESVETSFMYTMERL